MEGRKERKARRKKERKKKKKKPAIKLLPIFSHAWMIISRRKLGLGSMRQGKKTPFVLRGALLRNPFQR